MKTLPEWEVKDVLPTIPDTCQSEDKFHLSEKYHE